MLFLFNGDVLETFSDRIIYCCKRLWTGKLNARIFDYSIRESLQIYIMYNPGRASSIFQSISIVSSFFFFMGGNKPKLEMIY